MRSLSLLTAQCSMLQFTLSVVICNAFKIFFISVFFLFHCVPLFNCFIFSLLFVSSHFVPHLDFFPLSGKGNECGHRSTIYENENLRMQLKFEMCNLKQMSSQKCVFRSINHQHFHFKLQFSNFIIIYNGPFCLLLTLIWFCSPFFLAIIISTTVVSFIMNFLRVYIFVYCFAIRFSYNVYSFESVLFNNVSTVFYV